MSAWLGQSGSEEAVGATPMFGREGLLQEVLLATSTHPGRLVTLTGRGGVGKTRLAVEVAHQVARAEAPRRSVAMVELAGVSRSELVFAEIADQLGVPGAPDAAAHDHLARILGSEEVLLVLDNLEHLVEAAPRLGVLVSRCSGLRVLVTSQKPLVLQRERVIEVPPLPVPLVGETRLEVLRHEPAVAAYADRAGSVDARFALDPVNAEVVAELCRRLEGLPLAIELAAARAATLSAAEIVRRLDLDLLQRPHGDAPSRQHDLRSAILWTYSLLTPAQQDLVGRLAIVSGSFTIDDAVELSSSGVATEVIDDLGSLVDLHLVDRVTGSEPTRFVLPPSIRQVAGEQLGEDERAGLVARHVQVRAGQARRIGPGIEPADDTPDLTEALAAHDDLFAALEAGLATGAIGEALTIVVALAQVWHLRGFEPVHQDLFEQVLDGADRSPVDPVDHASALLWSAMLGLRHVGAVPPPVLVDRIAQAESLAELADDDVARLRVISTWLLVSPVTGDRERAATAADRGRELAERGGNPRWVDGMAVWCGMLANQSGDIERAIELGSSALAGARRRGDRATILRATMLLLPFSVAGRDLAVHVPSTLEAFDLARQLGEPLYQALLLPRLVVEATRAGDLELARLRTVDLMRLARTMPGSPVTGFHLLAVVGLAHAVEDDEQAAVVHGAIRSLLPLLEPHLSPSDVTYNRRIVEEVQAALGSGAFERAALRGEALDLPAAVDEALRWATAAQGPPAAVAESVPATQPTSGTLTARQQEVLGLLAAGLSNKEIALRLGVSAKTVMHHTVAIYERLGVRGRSEATAWAFRNGAVDLAVGDDGRASPRVVADEARPTSA